MIVEQLYLGAWTAVYRAVKQAQQQPVVIKLLQREYPSMGELVQFRNQYTIAKSLNLPGIIHPYSLEPYGNRHVLVMEDFGGISLREWMGRADGAADRAANEVRNGATDGVTDETDGAATQNPKSKIGWLLYWRSPCNWPTFSTTYTKPV
jgi:hypothetical protein